MTEELCNGIGSFHCWHMTGKRASPTAPRDWCEFVCCHCAQVKTAENFVLLSGPHGTHRPAGDLSTGYSIW